MKILFFKLSTIFSMTIALTACDHMLDRLDLYDQTVNPPTYPADIPPPPKTNGTIYQSGYEVSLYEDHIAKRVGDILTVRLEETTQGEKNANMKTDKITSNNTNNGTLTNNPSLSSGSVLKPVLFGGTLQSAVFETGTDMEFAGKGQTAESNKLHGTISVTVMRVLSNNYLMIQGESWITINQGREYIRLSGIARPEDVDANNTISSQRIANARIAYSGSGQVGNAARGGLLTQLLFKFFPY
ncbi:MAG: flagellar basal body L-ring protein FlgH [Gammaproteobacteria bacterium]